MIIIIITRQRSNRRNNYYYWTGARRTVTFYLRVERREPIHCKRLSIKLYRSSRQVSPLIFFLTMNRQNTCLLRFVGCHHFGAMGRHRLFRRKFKHSIRKTYTRITKINGQLYVSWRWG